jgi:transcriptional regulator with XRE-family HTH domain
MQKIRLSMHYSIAEFAELLGYPKATYQCYENGTRPLPEGILKIAQDAKNRDVKFFKDLPKRLDKLLKNVIVPNDAKRGEW